MANVLLMDDDSMSLNTLSSVLSVVEKHEVWVADNLLAGVNVVEKLGQKFHLLVIDISMFKAASNELLSLFARACPRAGILVLTRSAKYHAPRRYPQLRKPFTDAEFTHAVSRLLGAKASLALASVRTTERARVAVGRAS